MREFNEAVKFAAKIGLEVDVSLVTAYANYSEKSLTYIDVGANIPHSVPPSATLHNVPARYPRVCGKLNLNLGTEYPQF
ncbi:hypothetical protein PDO_5111 [Rhizobium sp. PDO1-076]|nr:hypothetical protein PDO_5111 [Rhizobium sp. PDO1-076]